MIHIHYFENDIKLLILKDKKTNIYMNLNIFHKNKHTPLFLKFRHTFLKREYKSNEDYLNSFMHTYLILKN